MPEKLTEDRLIFHPYATDPFLFKNNITMEPDDIRHLLNEGACQPGLKDDYNYFSVDSHNRRFNPNWYKNGDIIRSWLIYSPRANALFCFPCWLFAYDKTSPWANAQKSFRNFKKGIEKICRHESSQNHINAQNNLAITKFRLFKNKTVWDQQLKAEKDEITQNREALKRFLDVALFLAKQNLTFRGHREDDNSTNKGNFIELLELIKRYDSVLSKHLGNSKQYAKYTSPKIQNEFLNLMAKDLQKDIICEINKSQFFSVVVDSTIDLSRVEQMSLSIRFVNENGEVNERFLAFVALAGCSAEDYYNSIIEQLKVFNINLQKCRGQAYDGASTMSGHISGLQARIKNDVPEAIFVHCCAHNLNLALVDSINVCADVKSFFGTLEQIYVYITESLPRLKLFEEVQKQISDTGDKLLTLKIISTTRWSSHHSKFRAHQFESYY